MNFWRQLKKPIIGLSPMDGVTDAPFRYIVAKYSKPDVVLTEFINVHGIHYGAEKLFVDFLYHEIERPIVAQIYGKEPEYFYTAAQVACELGFDGVDINMGCPAKNVASSGSGAALIKTPDLAREIVLMTKKGVADYLENGFITNSAKLKRKVEETKNKLSELGVNFRDKNKQIPVSIKTRIGYDSDITEEWIGNLLKISPDAITLHGRTLKQLYGGSANWGSIARAVELIKRNNLETGQETIVLGNGDIRSRDEALTRITESKADGALVGRAVFGNPLFFKGENLNNKIEAFKIALEHSYLQEKVKGKDSFVQMRKHLAWYVKGFAGAASLRASLVRTSSAEEVKQILIEVLKNSEGIDNSILTE